MTKGKRKKADLTVAILDPEELASWINARTHWVLAFSRDCSDYADKFDRWLNVYPTYPTVVSLTGLVTFVPKAALLSEGLEAWREQNGQPTDLSSGEQDIVLIVPKDQMMDEGLALMAEIGRMARV